MKIKAIFITLFFLLIITHYLNAKEQELLAKDDIYQYSPQDIEAHLTVEPSPQADIILTAMEKRESSGSGLLKEYIKNIAFKQLYVHQELQKSKPTERVEFLVRETLRNYAYKLFATELALECQVTTSELNLAYTANKEKYRTEEKRKIAVLYKLFPENPNLHKEVISELERLRARPDFKENFIEYVKEHSDLPGATEGGIIDYFTTGTYGPTVEKYAFSTPKGEISPVFSATKGAYIIKCLDVKPAGYIPLAEVSAQLSEELFQQKFSTAKRKKMEALRREYKIWMPEIIPPRGPAEIVLLKVNDVALTWGVLFSAYPGYIKELEAQPELIMSYLKRTVELEMILQNLGKRAQSPSQSMLAKELQTLKTLTYFRLMFYGKINQEITVSEDELRNYYEKYKKFYHATTPKRLVYILINPPDKRKFDGPNYYKELERQKRVAQAFQEKVKKQPETFAEEAQKLAKQRKDTIYAKTSYIEEFPLEWGIKTSIIEFNLGSISPIIHTSQGLLIFKVMDTKAPRILSFDEVRDKVYRVIFSSKQNERYKEIQKRTLEDFHFTFTF